MSVSPRKDRRRIRSCTRSTRSRAPAIVTVRNIITSMRMISDVDWPELFERVSLVDDVLCAGSAFRDMDFPTRNLYRSAIEELARGANRTELDVARRGDRGSKAGGERFGSHRGDRRADPGYYLLAGGRRAFETAIGFRPPPRAWPGRLSRRLGIGGYVGCRRHCGRRLPRHAAVRRCTLKALGPAWLGLLGVLGLVPAIDAAVAVVNRAVTRRLGRDAAARAGTPRRRAR